jgi:hypothetical protein
MLSTSSPDAVVVSMAPSHSERNPTPLLRDADGSGRFAPVFWCTHHGGIRLSLPEYLIYHQIRQEIPTKRME